MDIKFLLDLAFRRRTLIRALAEYELKILVHQYSWESVECILIAGGAKDRGSEQVLVTQCRSAQVVSVNVDPDCQPQILCDLERPWPVKNEAFDCIVSMWVLEHLKEPNHFADEACRVLTAKGRIILSVPFIHRVHGSPQDFLRYTDSYLYLMLSRYGFTNISIRPIGGGPFLAAVSLLWPLFKLPLLGLIFATAAAMGDSLLVLLSRTTGRGRKLVHSYPIAYLLFAEKTMQ